MSVKQKVEELSGIYFITITCHNWLNLFDESDSYSSVYNWFAYLKSEGNFINGYVIMPNHLHALISFYNTGKNINKIIGNGKRFMAYQIVGDLGKKGKENVLFELANGVNSSDRKRGKLHQVFEPSFDIKECFSPHFILQKLNYIHFNPCTGKWQLSGCPENYIHSSALYYSTGIQRICEVTNIMEMMDIDLE